MEPEFLLDNYSRVWHYNSTKMAYFLVGGDVNNGLTLSQLFNARGPLHAINKGEEVQPIPVIPTGQMAEFNMADVGAVAYGTVKEFDDAKQVYTLEVRIGRDKVKRSI
jgi:hypothetical protein